MELIPIKCDLTPLVQSIPNGVSKIFDLAFGKMVAKKEAAKKLIEAQAERESRLIIDGKAHIDKKGNFINHELNAEDNLNQCLEFAVNEAMNRDSEPSSEDISMTFFNKWRENAKTIDEPHLKQLWAKLLVDEIYKPDSISLRVLNTISMLSAEEAKLFQSSMKYMINNEVLILDFIPLEQQDSILDTLFTMGAIAEVPNKGFRVVSGLNFFFQDQYKYFHFPQQKGNLCVLFKTITKENPEENGLALQFVRLTAVGKTLYNLAYSYDENDSLELIKSLDKNISDLRNVISISLHKINSNGELGDKIFTKNL
ncbi:DUF2806 domain-containing protein [Mannheimia bovis]|uniref:DUF2806 domain-containing protein n=1 Tax=Mannheimia bovis TaxID=2770636 RepID=UPI0024B842B5|nr:DUF2806 domain-containing protein [Mannheimia bovis]WHP46443.1 DUF2806 domain-containing protein [Mannheimia bovis]